MRTPIVLICALVAVLPGTAAAQDPFRVVVAVGNDLGLRDELPLEFAASDAVQFADVFVQLGGVSTAHTTVVRNASPIEVLLALRDAGDIIRAHSGPSTFFFYYSGHGDAEHLHLNGQKLSIVDLQERVELIPSALRFIVLDSCRSGAGRRKGLARDDPFDISVLPPSQTGTVTVRSASDGEASQESDDLGGAIFTHYLLSALRGAGDRDVDGRVSFDEAYAYAYGRTVKRSAAGVLQHPSLEVDLKGAGPLILTRLRNSESVLHLPRGSDVQYLVYAVPAGTVMAEVWAKRDADVRLAVPAGRFLVQRRGARRYGTAEVYVPYGGERTVHADEFDAVEREMLVLKGATLAAGRSALSAHYAAGTDAELHLVHRVDLRLASEAGPANVGGGASWALSDYETSANRVQEQWVGGEVFVGLPIQVGMAWLSLSIGATVQGINQRLEDIDAAALSGAGYEPATSAWALGGGGNARVGLEVPLGENLIWTLAVHGELIAVPQAGGIALRARFVGGTGFGWQFF